MSNRDMNFEDSIRKIIDGAEVAPSAELWSRVNSTLDGVVKLSPLVVALRWCGAAAAVIVIALAANIWLDDSSSVERYESYIAEFKELNATPIALEPIAMVYPKEPQIVEASPKSEVGESRADVEQANSIEQSVDTPPVEQPAAPTEATQSESRVSTYSRSAVELPSTPRSSSARNPIGLAMAVSGGASSTSSTPVAGINGTPYLVSAAPSSSVDMLSTKSYNPSKAKHQTPISAALSVAYPLNDRWSLESGLSYTVLNSDLKMAYANDDVRQRLDLVGVPLRVNYNIYSSDAISLYAGAGGMLERCVSAKLHNRSVDEVNWHTSLGGVVGLQYNINKWLGIYTEPEMTCYLTDTELTTIRTESALSLNIKFGLRFTLGQNR